MSFAHTFDDAGRADAAHDAVLRDVRAPLDLPRRLARGVPLAGAELRRGGRSSAASSASRSRPEILDELDRDGWELYDIGERSDRVPRRGRRAPRRGCASWSRCGGRRPRSTRCCRSTGRCSRGSPTERPQTSQAAAAGSSTTRAAPSCPSFAAPPVLNRPHSIEADVEIADGGAERRARRPGRRRRRLLLLSSTDGRLRYVYNYLGRDQFELRVARTLSAGAARAALRVRADGRARLRARARARRAAASSTSTATLVANAEFPHTTPLLFELEGLSCGYDFGAPAAEATSRRSRSPARSTASRSTCRAS